MTTGTAAREISYAHGARTPAGRAAIRAIENLTGRPRLLRMAQGYEADVAAGADFWEVMAARYGVRLEVDGLERIPTTGPAIVVANHPFGILDGLAMGLMLRRRRADFRILAHQVFGRAPDVASAILPISFDATREGMAANLATRRAAEAHVAGGGCLAVFPGGTVSTAARAWGRALDPAWKTFTAKLVQRTGAPVFPVFFDGANSRLFQIASHAHMTLRLALLIREFGARLGEPVRAHVGEPPPATEIARHRGDARALMAHLRTAVYALSPTPLADISPGRSFD
ncbi:lysophospholipid acyltransferase family protein [Rubrimonas cliftonensis]|uniref:Putative hemolysin n=1 Tax=Rubrimonas cliftonensis TaxID=89524 RepID=A0A1H3VZD4_9RHOB|nr:lysophospholipid acyltransferase family protein [Rubrimonas cliftonensis]SDZ79564.1 Putative hemolysin [Rubrimonas cliftonensis]